MLTAAPASLTACARRFAAFAAALLVAFTCAAIPLSAPRAQAQATVPNASDWNFTDCSFRLGDLARTRANNTCWISFTQAELTQSASNPLLVTKTIGPYTLSMRIAQTNTDDAGGDFATGSTRMSSDSAFGDTTAGQRVFAPHGGDTKTPIIRKRGTDYIELDITEISLTRGGVQQDFRVVFADAESTRRNGTVGEMISVVATGGANGPYSRITPNGYQEACSSATPHRDTMFGPGQFNSPIQWYYATSQFRDFVCRIPGAIVGNPPERPGTWVYERQNPTSLRVALAGSASVPQAFALGIDLSRASVPATPVSVDSQVFEQRQTGQATVFNASGFQVFNRQGQTDTPIDATPGSTGAYIRARTAGEGYAGSVVYRSTATGAQAGMATRRYEPTWTCSLTDANSTSITRTFAAGTEPTDMPVRVNNSADGTSSEVVVTDTTGRVPSCSVQWRTRFQPANLRLQKTVTGNAENYTDLQRRVFTISYTCNDIESRGVRVSQAYPGIRLAASENIERGTARTVTTLPRGASCTVREEQASAQPPAGTTLDLQWNQAPTAPAQTPNGGGATYTVTLQENNAAHAYNQYMYGTGTLVISKEILGQPVEDGFQLDSYEFDITCAATNLPPWRSTISMSRSGTRVNGSTEVSGIPVGQDCTVRPRTDLVGDQRNQIRFAGRTVTVDGATVPVDPNANYAYHFTLPAGGASRSEMHFRTQYEYVVRDVSVRKLVEGPAAASADLEGATFTVNYRCTAPTGREIAGTVHVGQGEADATIPQVPVGSACNLWEEQPGDTENTRFVGAVLRANDANDATTQVDNEDGRTTPVLTVWPSQQGERNLVTVVNAYDYKLGTVSVGKVVRNSASTPAPSTYTIRFSCGTRNIGSQVVLLTGSAEVSAGGRVTLSASNDLANDQSGAMGVPYGNTCTFTEDQPQYGDALIMATDVAQQSTRVAGPETAVTVTNTFTPAGDGVTITQILGGAPALIPSEGISYSLTCRAAATPEVPLPQDRTYTFSLDNGESFHVPAEELSLGSECVLTEQPADDLQRTNFNGTAYAIDRELILAATGVGAIELGVPFTVGQQTVVGVSAVYSYKPSTVTTTKVVEFDPATEQYISDERKQVKLQRQFPITLVCTNPDGTDGVRISTTISNGQRLSQGGIPEGAECTGLEGPTTTATGITLTTRIGLNTDEGATAVEASTISFTARAGEDQILLENIYSRRLTDIPLEKIARLPGDVRGQYASSGQDLQEQLHNHRFDIVCADPLTGDTATLFTQTRSIQGEGTTTFNGVPVGADCAISGDNFGSLHLTMQEGQRILEAYLAPEEVDWVVDRAGGNVASDTELAGGTTQSPTILTVDSAEENHVTLTNHYNYEYSTVRLDKKVTGNEEDLDLLDADTRFRFALRCEAIGYQTDTVGTGDAVIPTALAPGDFNGQWEYSSPHASVPAGALCTFQEVAATGLPQELEMTVTSGSNADPTPKDPATATGRAPEPGQAEPTVLEFTNAIERRTSPVGIILRQEGYLVGAAPEGYAAAITCGAEETRRTYPLASVVEGRLPTGDGAVLAEETVALPVGMECSISFDNSPALAARGEVEVVRGDRRPCMRFATWNGPEYTGSSTPLAEVPLSAAPQKNYETTFTVPGDAPSTMTTYVVGAEFYHPRATYDVTFTKESAGAGSENNRFTFSHACGAGEETFTLRAGGSHVIKDVPVNRRCTVTEVKDGVQGVDPALSVTARGDLIAGGGASTERRVAFAPVATSGEDTSRSGSRWSISVLNSFPGIEVTKRIPGTPVSAVTGAVADRSILPDDATSFEVTYTVENTGVFDAQLSAIADPSLAGYAVTSQTGSAVIGPDGAIPAEVCPADILAPGATYTCAFSVDISGEPMDETFSYFGEVGVAALSNGQTVVATDSYGALRLTGVLGGLLPDTGMQSLAWLLALGLLLFGFGAWRYLRRDDAADVESGTAQEKGGTHAQR
ncbi:DUF5979 domain-containing protein [Corynebacterium auris]|uniref:DUF5979 domain-containing protein n=1 Tax=Corynebacterium auris TaxID=44750 RepID=UPI0025B312FF|nr:DUF5979 domain-containing protein [Corynebacterium auris]WJY68834.1 hypothetical protein CAURIS_09800 [Corynebacterium auris]